MIKRAMIFGIVLYALMLPCSAQKYVVNTTTSKIEWLGEKINGKHNGFIQLKSGKFTIKEKRISEGTFVIDMASMSNEDLKGNKDKMKELMDHLKSNDFFGVEQYPEARLVIVKSDVFNDNQAKISGYLTIRDKSQLVNFVVIEKERSFTTKIIVDRNHYDIPYSSGSFIDNMIAKAINDKFTLTIDLHSYKVP